MGPPLIVLLYCPVPILFLIYNNDLPDGVISTVRLFADVCIIYRPISNSKDTDLLQSDLDAVGSWENTWLMQFNADKCFIMRASKGKELINKIYRLHDHPLQTTDSSKYLDLTLTSDLKWHTHISNATRKANSILGFLGRNHKTASQTLKTQAYQSLVRPHREYDTTVWSPHTAENVNKLEMVQRRAARYTYNRFHNTSTVSEMIGHLGWESSAVLWHKMRLRISRTPAGDAWKRWLTMSTRQTHRLPPVEVYSSQLIK